MDTFVIALDRSEISMAGGLELHVSLFDMYTVSPKSLNQHCHPHQHLLPAEAQGNNEDKERGSRQAVYYGATQRDPGEAEGRRETATI